MMWRAIAGFEVKHLFRSWTTHLFFAIFFSITLVIFLGLGGAFQGASIGTVNSLREWANSPSNLYQYISMINLFTILLVAGMVGNAVQRDRTLRTDGLFFTKPITKINYLVGRFLGTLLILVYISASVGLGAFVASQTPFVEAELFGPHAWSAYLHPYFLAVLPNIFICGSFFFAVAATTRKKIAVYRGGGRLLVFYSIATEWSTLFDFIGTSAILDPFGFFAEQAATRYWTIAEKNTLLLPFSGLLMINRVLWLLLSCGAAIFAIRRFSFSHDEHKTPRKDFSDAREPLPEDRAVARQNFSGTYAVKIFSNLVKLEFWETLRSPAFLVMLLAAVSFVLAMSGVLGDHLGTRTVPVTYAVIELFGNSFSVFVVLIIAFIAGEMVWRERDAGVFEMCDSSPIPTWASPASKLGAIFLILLLMMGILLVCCIGVQTARGYTNYELDLYLGSFFGIKLAFFFQVAVFALFFQTISNRKSMGHFLLILVFILAGQVSKFGWDHYLVRLFRTPRLMYSDMNGYGHLLVPHIWFSLYWTCWAALVGMFSALFWNRGTAEGWRSRWSVFRKRCRPGSILALSLSATAIFGIGGFIFLNTNVINHYHSPKIFALKWVDYEKTYGDWRERAQPKTRDVAVQVDLFPAQRRVEARGTYHLENDSSAPIAEVLVCFVGAYSEDEIVNPVMINRLALDAPFTLVQSDSRLGAYVLKLESPLQPGQWTNLDFDVTLSNQGFPNGISTTRLVENGTFIPDRMILPRSAMWPIWRSKTNASENDTTCHRVVPSRHCSTQKTGNTTFWKTIPTWFHSKLWSAHLKTRSPLRPAVSALRLWRTIA